MTFHVTNHQHLRLKACRHAERPGNSRHSTVKGSVLTYEPPARAGRQQGVCRAAGALLLNST